MTDITGTWRLVAQHVLLPDGTAFADRGEGAQGILMYDAFGNMSVQLMRTDDRAGEYTDLSDVRTAMEGYHAYYGRYELDSAQGVVRHHVVGAAYAPYRGSVQVREFTLEQNRLTLIARSPYDGKTRTLIWERVQG